MMEITSKFFGVTPINPDTIVTMIQPIYGFEDAKNYTIITDQEIGNSILWFQSLEQTETCFILANPEAFALKTPGSLSSDVLDLLQVSSIEDLDFAYIINIKESLETATVNLKSPIVFNPVTKKAAQIILNEDLPLRERLTVPC